VTGPAPGIANLIVLLRPLGEPELKYFTYPCASSRVANIELSHVLDAPAIMGRAGRCQLGWMLNTVELLWI